MLDRVGLRSLTLEPSFTLSCSASPAGMPLDPCCESLIEMWVLIQGLGWGRRFSLLTSFWEMPVLPVQGAYLRVARAVLEGFQQVGLESWPSVNSAGHVASTLHH